MPNQFDPPLQGILDEMRNLALDAEGKVGSAAALERNLLLYIQDRCLRAYQLGMARGTCYAAGKPMPPIPQWLRDIWG
jgi:hypothetical protein